MVNNGTKTCGPTSMKTFPIEVVNFEALFYELHRALPIEIQLVTVGFRGLILVDKATI